PANFCRRLNDHLETRGMGRPVWRTCGHLRTDFHWSGSNDHAARLAAALELVDLVQGISTADKTARIHLIAHSHGGNVVLAALDPLMLAKTWPRLGRVVFMGTPFLFKTRHAGRAARSTRYIIAMLLLVFHESIRPFSFVIRLLEQWYTALDSSLHLMRGRVRAWQQEHREELSALLVLLLATVIYGAKLLLSLYHPTYVIGPLETKSVPPISIPPRLLMMFYALLGTWFIAASILFFRDLPSMIAIARELPENTNVYFYKSIL